MCWVFEWAKFLEGQGKEGSQGYVPGLFAFRGRLGDLQDACRQVVVETVMMFYEGHLRRSEACFKHKVDDEAVPEISIVGSGCGWLGRCHCN